MAIRFPVCAPGDASYGYAECGTACADMRSNVRARWDLRESECGRAALQEVKFKRVYDDLSHLLNECAARG